MHLSLETKAGLGVIGLTTALKIQEQGGYQVTIIAEVLPTDPKTIKYTSHWAVSFFSTHIMIWYIVHCLGCTPCLEPQEGRKAAQFVHPYSICVMTTHLDKHQS